MKVVFTASAWQDYLWFQEQSRQLLKRINDTFATFPFGVRGASFSAGSQAQRPLEKEQWIRDIWALSRTICSN
jgi:Txe/YoeB family toxin of Txe-Axe toxin-antitoxin module